MFHFCQVGVNLAVYHFSWQFIFSLNSTHHNQRLLARYLSVGTKKKKKKDKSCQTNTILKLFEHLQDRLKKKNVGG